MFLRVCQAWFIRKLQLAKDGVIKNFFPCLPFLRKPSQGRLWRHEPCAGIDVEVMRREGRRVGSARYGGHEHIRPLEIEEVVWGEVVHFKDVAAYPRKIYHEARLSKRTSGRTDLGRDTEERMWMKGEVG